MGDWVVVAYDVVKNRRRARLRRALLALVPSVQKSVFEGPLPPTGLPELQKAIRRTIDHARDTVRIYRLCAACRDRTLLHGTSMAVPEEPEDVVVE